MARPRLSVCMLAVVRALLASAHPPSRNSAGSSAMTRRARRPTFRGTVTAARQFSQPPADNFPRRCAAAAVRCALRPAAGAAAAGADEPAASQPPGRRRDPKQPLAPLPGVPVAPQPPAQEQPQQGARSGPAQTLPGLPPGVRQPRGSRRRAISRRSRATKWWWSRRRSASPIRPRCSPGSTRSPAASSRSTSPSTRPCSSARCR